MRAALEGFRNQRFKIDLYISDLERELEELDEPVSARRIGRPPAKQIHEPKPTGKRKMSPAGRKAISEAGKKRWAAFRQAKEAQARKMSRTKDAGAAA